MARYYFHIKDGAELIKDQEGTELPTPDAARRQALKSARELWANAIRSGKNLWSLTQSSSPTSTAERLPLCR